MRRWSCRELGDIQLVLERVEALPGVEVRVAAVRGLADAGAAARALRAGAAPPALAALDAAAAPLLRPVLAACVRAARDRAAGRGAARAPGAEIVLALSGSKHVAEAFQRFGVSAESSGAVLVCLADELGEAEFERAVAELFPGDRWAGPGPLPEAGDLSKMAKLYKLRPGETADAQTAEDAVLAKMALRGL